MEKQFLRIIHDNQAIIYKISALYRNSKEDREDLFQEIVYQIWKSYPVFRNDAKVSSWIYRIALNTAIVIYRKPRAPVEYHQDFSQHLSSRQVEAASENEERLFEALRLLNDSEKAIISLYLEDFNYKEMAAITGLSESNIGVRLNRIKGKLKEIIK